MIEIRAFIDTIRRVRDRLAELGAEFKGEYGFCDHIYFPKEGFYDLNYEFVRVRAYRKTNWNQKPVELTHKWRGRAPYKKEFEENEDIAYLHDYRLGFSFSRTGFEYAIDGVRVFVEEVEGLAPSIELLSLSAEKVEALFEELGPVEKVFDSVPKLYFMSLCSSS